MTNSTGGRRSANRRNSVFSLLAKGSALLILGAAGLTIVAPSAQADTSFGTPQSFSYTDSQQTYSVPANTTAVEIEAVGAAGGSGLGGGPGGNGADVTATVTLPPNTTTLYVEVGGVGTNAGSACFGTLLAGGFNGGGASYCGGSGGGASDVRTLSSATTTLTTNDSRLVVAGGGGGGGGLQYPCTNAGSSGGSAGVTNNPPLVSGAGFGGTGQDSCTAFSGQDGGSGGTSGTGGMGSSGEPNNGGTGSLGQGGSASSFDTAGLGGGGGGGYYGGGGGGDGADNGGGGGAGSSNWDASADTNYTMNQATPTGGVGSVTITPIITTSPDLSFSDTAPSTATKGVSYSYALTATNTGTADASGVTISDTLPSSLHIVNVGFFPVSANCTESPAGSKKSKNLGTEVICSDPGALAPASSETITVMVTPTTRGIVTDSNAGVTALGITQDGDDSASATTTVTGH